jgi:hypothetical protein
MAVFWVVAPCSLEEVYRHFRGTSSYKVFRRLSLYRDIFRCLYFEAGDNVDITSDNKICAPRLDPVGVTVTDEAALFTLFFSCFISH